MHDLHQIWLNVIVFVFEWKESKSIDDSRLIIEQIVFNELVMILAIHLWHQNIDFLIDQLLLQIAKHNTGFHIDIDDSTELFIFSPNVDQWFTNLSDIH